MKKMSFKTLSICSGCLVLVLAGILSFGSNATPSTFVSTGDFVAPDGSKLFSVDDLTTLDNKIETVSTELDTLEASVGNNKTEILNALSTNPNLDVNPDASFADITTYIQNMSNVPADTYFYEDGTEGDASTIVRYKKVGAEYFPCDAYGIVSEGAAAVDVSSKTLVPYSATAAGNLSAGSAGYASNSFILGDGSDNAAYYASGITFADSRINTSSVSYTTGYNKGKSEGYIVKTGTTRDLGTFSLQTISTGLNTIIAISVRIDGRYATGQTRNWIATYSAIGDVYANGGNICINYTTSGLNPGVGDGTVYWYAIGK